MAKQRSEHHRAIYDVMTRNGPDVDMWSQAFTRLVTQVTKRMGGADKVLAAYQNPSGNEIYQHLQELGMFGPKSDALRASDDQFY